MSEEYRQQLFAEMRQWPGTEAEFVVDRERHEPGLTFSEEAMEQLIDQVTVFIGSRVMRRWDETNEPPTLLRVELRVTAA